MNIPRASEMVVTMGMMMMAVVDPSMADLLFEWC
jgi:hypothetical protein